jgi:preprotein translocase subunit SecE
MEAATTNDKKDAMTDADEPGSIRQPPPPPPAPAGTGYFHIYKKGQGYWTRMGTVAGVVLVGALTGEFLFTQFDGLGATSLAGFLTRIHLQEPRGGYLLALIFAIVYSLLAYHYLNKPVSVDFLIATDSEMKKVNWTTRKELFGSTKIVIGFMFFLAILLFLYDLFFQLLFWWIGVLKTPPFFINKH